MYTGLPSGHGHDGEKTTGVRFAIWAKTQLRRASEEENAAARGGTSGARAPVPLSPAQGPEAELETLGPLNIELRLSRLGALDLFLGCSVAQSVSFWFWVERVVETGLKFRLFSRRRFSSSSWALVYPGGGGVVFEPKGGGIRISGSPEPGKPRAKHRNHECLKRTQGKTDAKNICFLMCLVWQDKLSRRTAKEKSAHVRSWAPFCFMAFFVHSPTGRVPQPPKTANKTKKNMAKT